MAKKFPDVIYVTWDSDNSSLLAWESLDEADEGEVASYELTQVVEKREVSEVRRKGTKTWFKP